MVGRGNGRGEGDGDFLKAAIDQAQTSFVQALDDDLNSPAAIATLQGLRSDVNKMIEKGLSTEGRHYARHAFRSLGNVFGLFQLDKWQFNPATPFVGMNVSSEMTHKKTKSHEGYDTSVSPPPLVLRVADDQQVQQKVDERNEAVQRIIRGQ